ncbi:prepilin-type N-terminal cleavage/methylation domain-containing protein [Verrucomicrobium spinosum]|uniref:prepilin-type N-terminal cleavage/methylation domain-containing protein n=1 Tax=Verrucomicrobium spinosum TaxID=2736 RepID=UPI00210DC1B9|nr:prepilin-type N-terminal cleavage/methylation domain-containing protein [Verrucomicrobium spinosum]
MHQSRCCEGFTLVEMLMVIAVMASFLVIGGLGVGRTLRAMTLTNAGNKVIWLMEMARQQAITKNTLNAVVLVKSLGTEVDGRAFTVLEYTVAGGWRQIHEWEVLPDGIVADLGAAGADATFFANSPQPFRLRMAAPMVHRSPMAQIRACPPTRMLLGSSCLVAGC